MTALDHLVRLAPDKTEQELHRNYLGSLVFTATRCSTRWPLLRR